MYLCWPLVMSTSLLLVSLVIRIIYLWADIDTFFANLAIHFANVYHWVIDSYLLVDREAETSIKYFALQLFTVPSVAAYIVQEHNIISRLLSIITSFFTNQINNKRVVYPPNPRAEIDVDTYPFKSKRFMPVFSDLRYIAHNRSVQKLIAIERSYMD